MSLAQIEAWEKQPVPLVYDGVTFSNLREAPAKRKGDWLQTYTGRAYWPLDPRPEDVCIEDIAHSLSMQCRYGGHCREFYSVAEHSIYVSKLVPPEHALVGLLHDATEAYVSDVPRPLKPHLANYEEIEMRNWAAIAHAFGLPTAIPDCVKDVDRRMCLREMRVLMGEPPLPLDIPGEIPDADIQMMCPEYARQMFLSRFDELWQARMAARFPAANHRRVA